MLWLAELLIDNGANVDHIDNSGESALSYAEVQGHDDVVDLLERNAH